MHTFQTPGETWLVIQTGAGRVTVAAQETDRTTVELTALDSSGEEAVAEARVEQNGKTVVVYLPRHRRGLFRQGPSVDIAVTCPEGTYINVRTESSDVRATGTFAEAW
ncbi:MAG: hypothetical protein ABIR34_11485 [Marmoricola sp.]